MHINVDLLAADVLSIQVLLEDLAHLYDGTDLAPHRDRLHGVCEKNRNRRRRTKRG